MTTTGDVHRDRERHGGVTRDRRRAVTVSTPCVRPSDVARPIRGLRARERRACAGHSFVTRSLPSWLCEFDPRHPLHRFRAVLAGQNADSGRAALLVVARNFASFRDLPRPIRGLSMTLVSGSGSWRATSRIARRIYGLHFDANGDEPPTSTLRKKNLVARCHLVPRNARSSPHAPRGATTRRQRRAP